MNENYFGNQFKLIEAMVLGFIGAACIGVQTPE